MKTRNGVDGFPSCDWDSFPSFACQRAVSTGSGGSAAGVSADLIEQVTAMAVREEGKRPATDEMALSLNGKRGDESPRVECVWWLEMDGETSAGNFASRCIRSRRCELWGKPENIERNAISPFIDSSDE